MRVAYQMREPALAVDMQTTCRDNALVKNLRVWETYQLVAPSWAMLAETAMRENLARLQERAP